MSIAQVPLQFEPVELHVVDALGQQDVREYFEHPAKAITEDVCVMKSPKRKLGFRRSWKELFPLRKLGVYEEVPKKHAMSIPLPARLILVTKPNIHGGPARKRARIVMCGNFSGGVPG